MMAVSRSAAGTWCGASHAGHATGVSATGGRSSSARVALAMTARGAACAAGSRATVSGSATATSCSERMRGQKASIGEIELESIGDEFIGGFTVPAVTCEVRPDRCAIWRDREAAHDPGIEAAKSAACRISHETGERREPARVEERRQRRGVRGAARDDAVHSVERHNGRFGHCGGETTMQIRPYDAVASKPPGRANQLPPGATALIGAPPQPVVVRGKVIRDFLRQGRQRTTITAMGPQHEAPRPAMPSLDIPAANCRTSAGALLVDKKQIVGSRFHAELRGPAIADAGEGGAQPPRDTICPGHQDPWPSLQLELW